ncbi:helix-hairpin-helix domain-containing protein [Syntrophomonas curvata]
MNMEKRWVAVGVFVLLIFFSAGVKYSDFKHHKQAEEDILLESADNMPGEAEAEAEKKIIEVYVTGAVKNPGVYRLKEGDRMHQAVELAGGTREDADARYLEMARLLVDGETIPIPVQGEVRETMAVTGGGYSSPAGSGHSSGGRVNINTASAREMADSLDGIGPSLGQRIVDYRNSNGMFKDITEIKNVSGIGDKRFEAIKDKITVR